MWMNQTLAVHGPTGTVKLCKKCMRILGHTFVTCHLSAPLKVMLPLTAMVEEPDF